MIWWNGYSKPQKQREVAPENKPASTATISTTMSQTSLDSHNPSRRSSTVLKAAITGKIRQIPKEECVRVIDNFTSVPSMPRTTFGAPFGKNIKTMQTSGLI